ncbi:hypothetical protein [Streptomyces sp. NPDC048277]|uniref:hypothetical protein n=1 Tax=Streptomyces sp. NPDC048277 TaxID=3155027 RepID=UPI0033EC2C5C
MTVTEPCVSLSTGTLSPDKRVNYSYGMVLGLDEFLQEQLYRQEKDYRHRRLLHGSGISYGLNVTAAPTADGNDQIVTVSPGAGIDQWGREFVVPDAQCVRIGSWLVAQEQASPGIVAEHTDGSGGVHMYVAASYASCLDDLVPVPGQPCGTSGQAQVASRIRDSWDIQLRWDRPAMPRWDSDRRLGRLLASVEVVANQPDGHLPGYSELFDAVRALADQAPNGPGDLDSSFSGMPVAYQIPAYNAFEVWEQVFDIWVTEVRPRLTPDLIAPPESSDPAIALGDLLMDLGNGPFDPANPTVGGTWVTLTGRPHVLNTQLIQQLSVPKKKVTDPVELVTLVPSLSTAGVLTVVAQFSQQVRLTTPIQVTTSSGAEAPFAVSAKDSFGNPTFLASVWTLTPPPSSKFTSGQKLTATFDSDSVLINGNITLNQAREDEGVLFLNPGPYNGSVLASATIPAPGTTATPAASALAESPPSGTPATNAEFVTITDTGATDQQLSFELWFHPEPRGARNDMIAQTPQVRAYDELTGNPLAVTGLTQDPLYGNAWTVTTDVPHNNRPFPAYVRFVFPAEGFGLAGPTSGSTELAAWIAAEGVEFTGWDPGESSIVAFHRAAAPDAAAPAVAASAAAAKRATPAKAAAPRTTGGRSQKR